MGARRGPLTIVDDGAARDRAAADAVRLAAIRLAPASAEEAEQCAIACALARPNAIAPLQTEHFRGTRNRVIWAAILSLHGQKRDVDAYAVIALLAAQNSLRRSDRPDLPDRADVLELADRGLLASNVDLYARQVLDAWSKREAGRRALEVAEAASDPYVDVDELSRRAAAALPQVTLDRAREVLAGLTERARADVHMPFEPTIVEALVQLRREAPHEYERQRQELKVVGVRVNALEQVMAARTQRPASAPPPERGGARHPLDTWREEGGRILEARHTKDGPDDLVKFDGTIRIARVESTWVEDPDGPDGWAEERHVTYRFHARGRRPDEQRIKPGSAEFLRLCEASYGGSLCVYSQAEKGKLYQYVQRTEARAERVEARRAIGPHRERGWLCPPGVVVREGKVAKAVTAIEPPGDLQDMKCYSLRELSTPELKSAARWIVDTLLRCDHADMAYTLPIVGMILSPPLWEYVPMLRSWQRYAGFIQGSSGIGKTQLVRYLMSFWGDFRRGEGLTTWLSSAAYLESLLHQVVGAPVFVSDWKKANMTQDQYRAGMALLQAYADRSSRGRADARGKAQRRQPPRCMLVIDGEDLPEGEQSTLGRLAVMEIRAHGETNRCATADDAALAPAMLALLPGVTARWIAWVQRNAERIGADIAAGELALADAVQSESTNRTRVLRNYAIQQATIRGFLRFLLEEADVDAFEAIEQRAFAVHAALAERQLGHVADEAAAEQFLGTLRDLLQTGHLRVAPRVAGDVAGSSGENPFADVGGNGKVVGRYHRDKISIIPSVALQLVNEHLSKGGGSRISAAKKSIEAQLVERGLIERQRPGTSDGSKRPVLWVFNEAVLGVEREHQADWTVPTEPDAH